MEPDLEPTQKEPETQPRRTGFWSMDFRKNVVEDASAPEYYSQRAIYVFSILFSPLFGAALLAINLKNKSRNGMFSVLAFALAFTTLSVVIASGLSDNWSGVVSILFGFLGGLILLNYFWDVYIGDEKYRTRSVRGPIVVAIVILLLYLLVAVVGR